jgi:hypothetical protein
MNATELAQKMLQWHEIISQAKALEKEICDHVLTLEKTQTVGDVRATYSKPRTTYDYEAAIKAEGVTDTQLRPYLKTSYDYKTACEEFSIKDIPYKTGQAKVTLKII